MYFIYFSIFLHFFPPIFFTGPPSSPLRPPVWKLPLSMLLTMYTHMQGGVCLNTHPAVMNDDCVCISPSALWQQPYVNVFKHMKIEEWKKVSKEGDVTTYMVGGLILSSKTILCCCCFSLAFNVVCMYLSCCIVY